MIVERLETAERDGLVERSAVLRWHDGEGRLRIEVPEELAGDADDASPFLAVALLPAMRRGEDLEVDGPVSPMLARGAERVRDQYRAWSPSLHPSEIRPAEERAAGERRPEVGCFFSRGLDSTYSAAVPRSHPGPVSRLLYVAGFETHASEEVQAEEIRRSRLAAETMDLPLSVLRTNVHEITDPVVLDWHDMVGAALAFAGLTLGGGLGAVVVPATDSGMSVGPAGSSPMLEPLFSTETVAIDHDAVTLGRVGKVLWLARERPDLLALLKVCFREDRPDNCGHCGKCVHTMAALQAVGALDAATQFPPEVNVDEVRTTVLEGIESRVDWMDLARELDDGGHEELLAAVLEALAAPGWTYPGPPQREETPDFRGRHSNALLALYRDGLPWPARAADASPPGMGLVRVLDARRGRHVYGIDRIPPGELVGELGSLPRDEARGLDRVWLTAGGHLATDAHRPRPVPRSMTAAARWAIAPLAWRDVDLPVRERARAGLARARRALGPRADHPSEPAAPVAFIHRVPGPGKLPLYSGIHPVTGDQLLSTHMHEPGDLGYQETALLGYIDARAPLTGRLGTGRPVVPWASRFGARFRRNGEGGDGA